MIDVDKLTEAEQTAVQQLEQDGWTVFRRGMPDFLAVKGDLIKFVEVKRKYDALSSHQREVIAALKGVGIWCEVLRVAGDSTALVDEDGEALIALPRAACLLGVKIGSLKKLIRRGEMPSAKIGSEKFIRYKDLVAFANVPGSTLQYEKEQAIAKRIES
jgi:hypothetical protein